MPRNIKTGLVNPPVAPCVRGGGLMCLLREYADSKFECIPEDCHFMTRCVSLKLPEKQDELI